MNSTAAATRFLVGFSAAVALEKGGAKKREGAPGQLRNTHHPMRCNFIALPVFGLRYNTSDVERKFGGGNT